LRALESLCLTGEFIERPRAHEREELFDYVEQLLAIRLLAFLRRPHSRAP
jgi:hypothetical protein